MNRKNKDWKKLLNEKQGGKKDFFIECRFIFYSASFIAFIAFIMWLEYEYSFLKMLYEL